jgi:Tfp pilus assembly pilus retraction ATPase PilT
MARPRTKLTKQQVLEIETLAAVLSVEQMADYFGIGKTTFYELMKQQPGVSERYKKGKAKAISEVAEGLLTKAREGDTASTIFYLKTQAV